MRDRIPREKMAEIVDDLLFMDVKAVTFSGDSKPLPYSYCTETVNRLAEGGRRILRQNFYPVLLPTPGPRTITFTTNSKVCHERKFPKPKG